MVKGILTDHLGRRRKVDLSQQDQRETLRKLDNLSIQQAKSYVETGSRLDKIFSELQIAQRDNQLEHEKTRGLIKDVQALTLDRDLVEQFKNSLSFEYVDSRQQLRGAYPSTCQWIWKRPRESKDKVTWDDFPEWLESGSGIYWINGKAGSGESTLMSSLSEQNKFTETLKTWASEKRLVTPIFFFWRAGSAEQKSIHGLLRSLILQVLQNGPDSLVQYLEPFLGLRNRDSVPQRVPIQPRWHLRTLIDILRTMVEQANDSCRFCFVIDGVDEFEGDPEDEQQLLGILLDLSRVSNTKMCVSSRPEPYLLEAFGGLYTLKMQDLNRNDIGTYVECTLKKTTQMEILLKRDPQACSDLINKLCGKAEGIFLWAHLAVGDMLKGLWAMENLKQLHTRLDCLNESLTGIFRQLIANLDDSHKDDVALWMGLLIRINKLDEMFRKGLLLPIEIWGHAPLPNVLYIALASQQDRCSEFSTICLGDDNGDLSPESLSFWYDELMMFSNILKTRSAGLLDVSKDRISNESLYRWRNEPRALSDPASLRVNLVRRSVIDFLRDDREAYETPGHRIPSDADPDTMLFEVSLLLPRKEEIISYGSTLNSRDQASAAMHALCVRLLLVDLKTPEREISDLHSLSEAVYMYLSIGMGILYMAQETYCIGRFLRAALTQLDDCISNLDCIPSFDISVLGRINFIIKAFFICLNDAPSVAIMSLCAYSHLYTVLPQLFKKFSVPQRTCIPTRCLTNTAESLRLNKHFGEPQSIHALRTLVYLLSNAADPKHWPQI